MGNYITSSVAKESTGKGTKRRRKLDEDEETDHSQTEYDYELEKIQNEILNTPKRFTVTDFIHLFIPPVHCHDCKIFIFTCSLLACRFSLYLLTLAPM